MTNILTMKSIQDLTKSRNQKAIRFSMRLFTQMFQEGKAVQFTTDKPMPDDSTVIGVYYVASRDSFFLKILSKEFEPVVEGGEVPILDISATITECKCDKSK